MCWHTVTPEVLLYAEVGLGVEMEAGSTAPQESYVTLHQSHRSHAITNDRGYPHSCRGTAFQTLIYGETCATSQASHTGRMKTLCFLQGRMTDCIIITEVSTHSRSPCDLAFRFAEAEPCGKPGHLKGSERLPFISIAASEWLLSYAVKHALLAGGVGGGGCPNPCRQLSNRLKA